MLHVLLIASIKKIAILIFGGGIYIYFNLAIITIDNHSNSHLQKYFSQFRLSYYPHTLAKFNTLLESVFGKDAEHTVLKVSILLTKITTAQNDVALSYHRVRGLYFLAVFSAATIV